MLSLDNSGKSAQDALLQTADSPPVARARANSSGIKHPSSPLVASVTTKDLEDANVPFDPDTVRHAPSPPTSFTNILPPSRRLSRDPENLSSNRDSQQTLAGQTPQPYLPLRKKLTRSLKLGLSSSRRSRLQAIAREKANEANESSGSLADFAQRLRPQTARSSQDSFTVRDEGDSLPSSQTTAPTELSLSPQSPHLLPASNTAYAPIAPPTASPLPRPTTSTSEYDTTTSTHRYHHLGAPSPAVSEFPASKRPVVTQEIRVESGRDSVRSAMTNGSSVPDLSSNGRTSGLTDRSSTTDKEVRNFDWSKEQEELTVEDCILMYAQGFTDDPIDEIPPIPEEPVLIPPLPNQTSTTSTVESTVESTIKPTVESLSPLDEPTQGNSHTPSTSADSRMPLSERHTYSSTSTSRSAARTVSIAPHKPARDHYGFKKETQHVGLDQYDKWHADYARYMERRRKKWIYLMNNVGLPSNNPQYFPGKSDKVKRYIRKGIPPEWRGAAWFFYADGASFITKNPGLYQTLVSQAAEGHLSSSDREHIERDLHRTLPENKHFKPDVFSVESTTSGVPLQPESINDPQETEMILSLRRILQAFAVHHPKIGYCQSLNFLAAHLLLFMRAAYPNENFEERAFVMLCILTERHLPGTHGVVLEGANVDIGVLMMFIQESMPGLWAKLDDKSEGAGAGPPAISRKGTAALPTVSLATTAWFMSCFVSTLPVETTCRVWDCLWYEGTKTIFRVALAIFKLGERDIRRAKDSMDMFQIVQNLPRTILDANTLIEIATKKRKVPGGDSVSSRIGPSVGGFGGLSAKTVEMRRNERRQLARSEREHSVLGLPPPPVPEEPASTSGSPARSLSRSSSRSRLKRFKSMKKLA